MDDSLSTAGPASSGAMTVWCNAPFPELTVSDLRRRLVPHRLIWAGANASPSLPAEADIADADIAFGQPGPRQVIDLPRLRWVHLNTAGYTSYDTAAVRHALHARGGILTNSSSVYNDPCAQHVLAMMMALARRLLDAWSDQHGARQWPQTVLRASSRLLTGQTAVLFGYGAIGRRLADLLQPLHMRLVGVRRSIKGDEPILTIPTAAADEWLPQADHVVNLLPGAAGTERYFDARRIGLIKPGAILYNIGRGTTVDQSALLSALSAGRLSAAYLDVSDPEPLPPDSPLWTAPNCYVTPHAAGGHADEPERQAEHFLANLRRFISGEPLSDRVM